MWQAEHAWPGFPRLEQDVTAEVAVVGAGVTGASCAFWLRELGIGVVVVDARETAGGASGRNGGFASTGSGLDPGALVERLGVAGAAAVRRSHERAFDAMLALAPEIGADGAVARTGAVWLAAAAEAGAVAAEVAAMEAIGVRCRVDPELVPEAMRASYATAVVVEADGELQPAAWVRALATAAARRGARLFEHSPVRMVEPSGDGWVVRTPQASVRAGAVVVACDGLTPRLLPELSPTVFGVRGQMLVTEPARERWLPRPTHSDGGFMYYRQLADGRFAIGGARAVAMEAENTDEERVTEPVQRALDRFAAERMGLGGLAVERRWAGTMGFSADRLPVVGEVPGRPGVWVAAGYSGVGNVPGFLCGEALADLIAGHPRPDVAAYAVGRLGAGGGLGSDP